MNSKELLEYILGRKYYCYFCHNLQKEIREKGLIAIDNYKGMICVSIEDMMTRYSNIKEGEKE